MEVREQGGLWEKGVRALWGGTGPLSASQVWPRRSLIPCLTSCFQFSRQTGNPDFYIKLSESNCWQLILFCFWKAMGRPNKRCLKGKSNYNMFSKQTQVNFIWWISQSSLCMWNVNSKCSWLLTMNMVGTESTIVVHIPAHSLLGFLYFLYLFYRSLLPPFFMFPPSLPYWPLWIWNTVLMDVIWLKDPPKVLNMDCTGLARSKQGFLVQWSLNVLVLELLYTL